MMKVTPHVTNSQLVSYGVLHRTQHAMNIRPMKIGKAIAQIRKDRGLTLDELADLCEISKPSISRIESDKQWPSAETLERIARELDVYIYQLFAIAEDVDLPTAYASDNDHKMLNMLKCMEPETRYLIETLAEKITPEAKKYSR